MLELAGAGRQAGTIVGPQDPILRIPLEDSFDVYIKEGFEEYVGFVESRGTIDQRESRGGLDLSQDINIRFSDRVFSGEEWTMSWWMYPENVVDWHNIGSTEAATTNENTMLIQYNYNSFGGYFFINYPTGPGSGKWIRSRLAITQRAWNHFAVTWENGQFISYKNGERVATLNTSIFTGFGKYNWAVAQNKNRKGLLSNLMFFNEALSQEQIKECMAIYTEL